MPNYILHRVNTQEQLLSIQDKSWGCEIDLRSDPSRANSIYLAHDAWTKGELFSEWLEQFSKRNLQGPLILNTKEDGLEDVILEELKKYGITNYFFLDTAQPTLIRYTHRQKNSKFAIRLSEYEPLGWVEKFRGVADWVWVDCFQAKPLVLSPGQSASLISEVKQKLGMKLCLVSPELQGGSSQDFVHFREWANQVDAICTKTPQLWQDFLSN